MIKKYTYFLLPLFFLGALGILYFFYAYATPTCQQRPYVTVWIHGTQLTFRSLPGFLKKKALCLSSKYFYTPHGLVSAQDVPVTNRHHTIAHELAQADPLHYPAEHCYFFGWSGRLSFELRYEAAQKLYDELVALIQRYKKEYGVIPHLRLITHSHGGNVALNLARVHQEREELPPIDELILLACPVQHATAPYAQDTLFKQVYHLYAHKDIIQVGDPQRLYAAGATSPCFFSQRSFAMHPRITQVKVMMNRRPMFHVEFLMQRFVQSLPGLIAYVDNHVDPTMPTMVNIAYAKTGITFSHTVNKKKKVRI